MEERRDYAALSALRFLDATADVEAIEKTVGSIEAGKSIEFESGSVETTAPLRNGRSVGQLDLLGK